MKIVEREFGPATMKLETGRMAKQANGSVLVTYGDTVVLVAATAAKGSGTGADFFPLSVFYVEKGYAAGRIPGGFLKRESRLSDSETLISRIIDRPLRPAFEDNYLAETMIAATVLSHDLIHPSDVAAMNGASAALAITTEHSHPFSTGQDLCLVHNGSLSNHNRLRETLKRAGVQFKTDNDSEVAAGYLSWRLSEGDDLDEALNHAIEDLDGFYTFAIGTKDGFAVMRDPIGCKPAIMAETDDWAAMSSEYRAIATLPGAENARIWEPEPTQIYSWKRS